MGFNECTWAIVVLGVINKELAPLGMIHVTDEVD